MYDDDSDEEEREKFKRNAQQINYEEDEEIEREGFDSHYESMMENLHIGKRFLKDYSKNWS